MRIRSRDAEIGPSLGMRGVLISVGSMERLAADVVGIEVGVITARDGGHGQMLQFQWTEDGRTPATSEDTGVTVTSWEL